MMFGNIAKLVVILVTGVILFQGPTSRRQPLLYGSGGADACLEITGSAKMGDTSLLPGPRISERRVSNQSEVSDVTPKPGGKGLRRNARHRMERVD